MNTSEPDRLFLHEQIILLCLKDARGTFVCGTNASFAMAGAALSELLLMERLAIEGEGRSERVVLQDASSAGDPVLDECLALVADSRPRSPRDWITRFARIRDVTHRVAQGLARRGILRADEKSVLLIFSRRIYPEVDAAPERDLIERMRAAILDSEGPVDPMVAMLIAVARGADLLRHVFDKADLKAASARLDRIVANDPGGQATQAAVKAMQAAAATAAIVASSAAVIS